jgi:CBS-domain-containing membrane protein
MREMVDHNCSVLVVTDEKNRVAGIAEREQVIGKMVLALADSGLQLVSFISSAELKLLRLLGAGCWVAYSPYSSKRNLLHPAAHPPLVGQVLLSEGTL